MRKGQGKRGQTERERWQGAVDGYFAGCDATRERTVLKNGGFEERQIPYTLYGLSVAMEMPAKEVLAIGHGEKGVRWQQGLLSQALNKIAAYTMERALLGELSYQVALAALKELEVEGDEKDKETEQGITVTMEAGAEVYSR